MLRPLLALATALALAACHDATVDPVGILVAEETRAALALGEDGASLPGLVAVAGQDGELAGAVDLWLRSWEDMDASEGRAMRAEAYAVAAGPLAEALPTTMLRDAHVGLGRALEAADAMDADALTAEMRDELQHARSDWSALGLLLDGPTRPEAVTAALRASDALRSVGPEGVARGLVARAELGAGEFSRTAADGDPELARARRLALGARRALDDGAWSLAIRRAFYACQVMGISPAR